MLVAALLAVAATLSLLGSVRWGSPVLAAVAAACALFFLARLPGGRLCWLAAGAAVAPLLSGRARTRASPRPTAARSGWGPSWRSSRSTSPFTSARGTTAGSSGSRTFATMRRRRSRLLRGLSILATALVPALVAGAGVATRRAWLLDLGVLLAVASLVTLRFYVHVAPLWVVLVVSGLAALAATLVLRRALAGGRGGERGGFTAEALFEDPGRRGAAEVVGALATFSPAAQAAPAGRVDRGLEPGGGRYGGGGATGSF